MAIPPITTAPRANANRLPTSVLAPVAGNVSPGVDDPGGRVGGNVMVGGGGLVVVTNGGSVGPAVGTTDGTVVVGTTWRVLDDVCAHHFDEPRPNSSMTDPSESGTAAAVPNDG